MKTSLRRLERRLARCIGTDEYEEVIQAITATRDPDAIPILASLLDSANEVGAAAVIGLVTFGEAAEPAMRERIDAPDGDICRNVRFVLARLGDESACEDLAWPLECGHGPLASATWLIHCGRPGIEAVVNALSAGEFAISELVRLRELTEDVLLSIVRAGGPSHDDVALEALARMPSEGARDIFVRILNEPAEHDECWCCEIAARGMARLGEGRRSGDTAAQPASVSNSAQPSPSRSNGSSRFANSSRVAGMRA